MTTEFYRKTFTGKEDETDLDNIVTNYLNPEKIKNLRFVFVIKISGQKHVRKVDCYSRGRNWVRVNYVGDKRMTTNEADFNDLIKRSRNTMKLPKTCVIVPEYLKLIVYGDNE